MSTYSNLNNSYQHKKKISIQVDIDINYHCYYYIKDTYYDYKHYLLKEKHILCHRQILKDNMYNIKGTY